MSEYSKEAADRLKQEFGDKVLDISEFRDEITVLVEAASIRDVAFFCRDTDGLDFEILSALPGVDYYPEDKRFGVNYILLSLKHNKRIRLQIRVDEDEDVPSVTPVWPNANWPEREVYDMFGVKFSDHPDLRRILLPYDWTGYPQRKDYPLGYEEVQFSFNYDRVQAKKPHPKE